MTLSLTPEAQAHADAECQLGAIEQFEDFPVGQRDRTKDYIDGFWRGMRHALAPRDPAQVQRDIALLRARYHLEESPCEPPTT